MTPKLLIGTVATLTAFSLSTEVLATISLTNTLSGTAATYTNTVGAANSTSITMSASTFRAEVAQGNQMSFNSWHWRVNGIDTRELIFNSTGMVEASAGSFGSRSWALISGAGYSFSARIDYVLLDGLAAGQCILQQTMSVTNLGPTAIDMSLFNYADVDANGTFGTDSATFRNGDVTNIQVTDSAVGSPFVKFQGIGANAYEVRAFGAAPSLRADLTDTGIDNLANTGMPFANGDITAAFQWNRLIGGGQTISVVEILAINQQTPAPGALALIGLAGLVGSRRRRA